MSFCVCCLFKGRIAQLITNQELIDLFLFPNPIFRHHTFYHNPRGNRGNRETIHMHILHTTTTTATNVRFKRKVRENNKTQPMLCGGQSVPRRERQDATSHCLQSTAKERRADCFTAQLKVPLPAARSAAKLLPRLRWRVPSCSVGPRKYRHSLQGFESSHCSGLSGKVALHLRLLLCLLLLQHHACPEGVRATRDRQCGAASGLRRGVGIA